MITALQEGLNFSLLKSAITTLCLCGACALPPLAMKRSGAGTCSEQNPLLISLYHTYLHHCITDIHCALFYSCMHACVVTPFHGSRLCSVQATTRSVSSQHNSTTKNLKHTSLFTKSSNHKSVLRHTPVSLTSLQHSLQHTYIRELKERKLFRDGVLRRSKGPNL